MNPLWQQLASRASITLSQEQIDRLSKYIDLLLEANQTMNLTRIDTREEAEIGHVGDSLTLLPFLPGGAFSLADVGSGGGVPGIPLAIARADARVLLIESTQKKAAFLERAARELGLANVRVSSKRSEDEAHGPARQSFDVVVARALATMSALAEWCLPLTKMGGTLLAMKGARIAEELPAAQRAIRTLGGGEPVVHPVQLPGAEHHVIVEIRKQRATERRFPRTPAQVKEKPL